MPTFITVGYVQQILRRRTFLGPTVAHPLAAAKKHILSRIKQSTLNA